MENTSVDCAVLRPHPQIDLKLLYIIDAPPFFLINIYFYVE